MNKKLITLLTLTVTAILLIIIMLPAAANFNRNHDLDLAPIPVQPYTGSGDGIQKVERCSASIDSSESESFPPILDGTGIFQDLNLKKLTLSPASPVAAATTCTVSSLLSAS